MNYQDKNGKTALIAAAENGHEQLVSELINFGVNVNLKKQNGISALHLESQNGHLQNVQALLLKADNINALAPYKFKKNYTPLIFASMYGHNQVVNELLQKGGNVELKTQDGYNAILWAAKNNHENVVKDIIDDSYHHQIAKLFVDSFDDVSRLNCYRRKREAKEEYKNVNALFWADLYMDINSSEEIPKKVPYSSQSEQAIARLFVERIYDAFILTNLKRPKRQTNTGKFLSEALILASNNPQYYKRLIIELQVHYMNIASS